MTKAFLVSFVQWLIGLGFLMKRQTFVKIQKKPKRKTSDKAEIMLAKMFDSWAKNVLKRPLLLSILNTVLDRGGGGNAPQFVKTTNVTSVHGRSAILQCPFDKSKNFAVRNCFGGSCKCINYSIL